MDSSEGLNRLLDHFSISSGSDRGLRLRKYLTLLEKWSGRINLTASTEWNVLEPLFAEGLWASAFYPDGLMKHLDIGSGAGFPCIPIRIMARQMKLEMVESRAKRAYFLENAVLELGLDGTEVRQERLDAFLRNNLKTWDCFSWKALKLGNEEMRLLFKHAKDASRFWIFHAKDLPVQDAGIFESEMRMERQEAFPFKKEWRLSICSVKSVSRETF